MSLLRGDLLIKATAPGGLVRLVRARNLVVTEGAKGMLDRAGDHNSDGYTPYLGFVQTSGWTAYDIADTRASHSGWTELYALSGARPVFNVLDPATAAADGLSASKVMTSNFTSDTALAVRGMSIVTAAVAGSGILYAVADFTGGPESFPTSTVFEVIYTITMETGQ